MIKKLSIICDSNEITNQMLISTLGNQCSVQCNEQISCNQFVIRITLNQQITFIRQYNYQWELARIGNRNRVLSANIVKLEDGSLVWSNKARGFFRIKSSNTLEWVISSSNQMPWYSFNMQKELGISSVKRSIEPQEEFILYFNQKEAPEWSRTQRGKKPIVIITDHCDFDKKEITQDVFSKFEDLNLKITKGFFPLENSERKGIISFETNPSIINNWQSSGHELSFHSLYMSRFSLNDWIQRFKEFNFRSGAIETWIDHGYIEHNFSIRNGSNSDLEQWFEITQQKGLKNIWLYKDVEDVSDVGVDMLSFASSSFLTTVLRLIFTGNLKSIIRKYLLYYADFGIHNKLMKVKYYRMNKQYAKFGSHLILFIFFIVRQILGSANQKPSYQYAKEPAFVCPDLKGNNRFFFATLACRGAVKPLTKKGIDLLIKNAGLSIWHTYLTRDINKKKYLDNFEILAQFSQQGLIEVKSIKDFSAYILEVFNADFRLINGEITCSSNKANFALIQ